MKIIVLGVLAILMHGAITTTNDSEPEGKDYGYLTALQRISVDLDELVAEKSNHYQRMRNVIDQRFQAILQSDKDHHETSKAYLQRIIEDGSVSIQLGKPHIELTNNITKTIEHSKENDKENIQNLERETSIKVDALNEKRNEQQNELKDMVLKIFTSFSVPLGDCSELKEFGEKTSGIYQIKPEGMDLSFPAYCDTESDGGGWTVIQRRGGINVEDVNFNRSWNEYKHGFGSLKGEFWLGNDKIHALTKNREFSMQIYTRRIRTYSAIKRSFKTFQLYSEAESYKLHISEDDAHLFGGLNGQTFSTYDRNLKCYNGAGWWYKEDCDAAPHLNGPKNVTGKYGFTFDGEKPAEFSVITIRPK